MDKYFFYMSDTKIDHNLINSLFINNFSQNINHLIIDNFTGVVYCDSIIPLYIMENIIDSFSSDIGSKIFFLVSHTNKDISIQALQYAFNNLKNNIYSLSDVILHAYKDNKKELIKSFLDLFNDVPQYLISTMACYITCNLNSIETCKSLFIHRNTFNYRLSKFIDLTSLDIRDFYNASLFNLYLLFK